MMQRGNPVKAETRADGDDVSILKQQMINLRDKDNLKCNILRRRTTKGHDCARRW